MDDEAQLLFFDTFSHETSEELNLDLVQFPKPVVLSEVRIIPLGARVQADFPGGVRLGATNPSQFNIEFFVNDLSKPGASTFESLGSLDYKQNGNIQLPFEKKPSSQTPTDGLVLRGWYTTITLAVYGSVSKGLTENSSTNPSAHAAGGQTVEVVESRSPRQQEWNASEPRNKFKDSQDYQRYPRTEQRPYPEQYNEDWNQYQKEDEFKKEHWEGRGGSERWERGDGGQARHNSGRGSWDWSEGRQPENHERTEWSGRGSRRSWEEQQHNTRKRPHTPPPTQDKKWTKTNEKSPREGDPKEENAVAPFDTLSPGDVESISSDGEIGDSFDDNDLCNGAGANSPVNEPVLEQSPAPSTPEQDLEQYEPILSDEDIDDAEFQDYELDDMKGVIIEKPEEFDPNQPLSQIQHLEDPSLTFCENQKRSLHSKSSEEALKFVDVIESWQNNHDFSESWVEMLEQTVPLVSTSLHLKPDCLPLLVQWVKIGLDVERAQEQSQPAFKVRHLKAGLRLAHSITLTGETGISSLIEAGLFGMLVKLMQEQCMALSLKLLCLSALDGALSNRQAVDKFISFQPNAHANGVAFLLDQWQNTKVTRLKFVLNNTIRKLNLLETLCFVEQTCTGSELNSSDKTRLEFSLQSIVDIHSNVTHKTSHLKRFLPVAMHFTFPACAHDPHPAVYSFMKATRLLECLLLLLTKFPVTDAINGKVLALIEQFLTTDHGIRFLATQPEATQVLIKTLTEADQPLGLTLAHCLRAVSILDDMASIDFELLTSEDDVEPLKSLQLLCETAVGRFYVAHILSMANFSDPLFQVVKITAPNSTTKNLCLDLIHSTVSLIDRDEYLQRYGEPLRLLFTDSNKLSHLFFWVKQFDVTSVSVLCQELSANVDKAKSCAEELIPIVRRLKAVALPDVDSQGAEFEDASRRQMLLELFSCDGLSMLSGVLAAVASVFEHPELHAASLAGCKGTNVVNLMHPCLYLLRTLLALVAASQGAEFKNLTPVAPLLSTYELLHAFPETTSSQLKVAECLELTVKCLMTYTQPCSEEQLPKSTWTQMAAEVLRHISLRPNTALPGLQLLSKLLPKPLPVCGTEMVKSEDEKRIISFYRLWGAHLHPLASAIHELITLFSVTMVGKLAASLLEICGLLSDLGPSVALIVVQSVVEGLVAGIKTDRKMGFNSDCTRRRLCLLTALSARGAPKVALLHLLRSGGCEENGLITLLLWVLNKNIQDKFYVEIKITVLFLSNLFQPKEPVFSSEWRARPSKEIIQSATNLLLDLITSLAKEQNNSHSNDIHSAFEVLNLIADSDSHCHWVKMCLEGRNEPLSCVIDFCVANEVKRDSIAQQTVQLLSKCYSNLATSAPVISRLYGCDASNHEAHPLEKLVELVDNVQLKEIRDLLAETQTSDISLEKAVESEAPTNGIADQLPVQFLLQEATSAKALPIPAPLPALPESNEPLKIIDLAEIVAATLPEVNLAQEVDKLKNMFRDERRANESDVSLIRERTVRKPMGAPTRGRLLFPRTVPSSRGDTFRSRPPNTSRPPSLHVDDFLALESAGQQPTGPTGYNKQIMRAPKEMMVSRPRMRGRPIQADRSGRFMATMAPTYRR